MIHVHLPVQLQRLFETRPVEPIDAVTIRQMLAGLDARYPGIAARVCEPDGTLRRYVNIFAGGEDIRRLGGLDAELRPGTDVLIVPVIAGG